ncbi:hypothetical protein CCP3SC15_1930006 [Gammaproteobacteria bacterium]
MTELKPCPFCGAPGALYKSGDGPYDRAGCDLECHGFPEMIEKWNTRPLEDALRAELAQEKDDLDYCQANLQRDGMLALAHYERAQKAEAELAQARQRIAELEEAQRWIPVGEGNPPPEHKVIHVICPPAMWPQLARWDGPNKCFTRAGVTHWRPLPEPPEVGNDIY